MADVNTCSDLYLYEFKYNNKILSIQETLHFWYESMPLSQFYLLTMSL